MRPRLLAGLAALVLAVAPLGPPRAAFAAEAPDCLAVPGKAGSAIDVTIAGYPTRTPDAYRTVDGQREPVYRVSVGDTLRIPTRITNSGTCHYWTFGGDFTALGYDAFDTPGSSAYVEGIGGRPWATAIGVPTWDPDPDRTHPYTRRSERLYVEIQPGDTAKRLWPVTVDDLPPKGAYAAVRFRYDGTVSDPPLADKAVSKRIWLMRK